MYMYIYRTHGIIYRIGAGNVGALSSQRSARIGDSGVSGWLVGRQQGGKGNGGTVQNRAESNVLMMDGIFLFFFFHSFF